MSASVEIANREQTYARAPLLLTVQKWFWLVLAAEVVTIVLFQIPTRLAFDANAFGDYGLNLTAQFLIKHGYRPGVDFGYPYGPLSLLLAKLASPLFALLPFPFFS